MEPIYVFVLGGIIITIFITLIHDFIFYLTYQYSYIHIGVPFPRDATFFVRADPGRDSL